MKTTHALALVLAAAASMPHAHATTAPEAKGPVWFGGDRNTGKTAYRSGRTPGGRARKRRKNRRRGGR